MSENRSLNDELSPQFEIYKRFFDMSLNVNTFKACPYSTNLRLPKEINEKLDKIRDHYVQNYGINLSKNDVIVIFLSLCLNMNQGKRKVFVANRDGQGFEKFLDEFKTELGWAVHNHKLEQDIKKYNHR